MEATVAKQAGVGLMLGEELGRDGVVVKQLVPRGSADRSGRVCVGDQLLRVGAEDVTQQSLSNLRHRIIGEIGTLCEITFRSQATGQSYTVELQRGTPEFLDSLGPQPSHRSIGDESRRLSGDAPQEAPATGQTLYNSSRANLYRSEGGGSVAAEGLSTAGGGRTATLQEENDWLRSALRLAEAHVKKDKEELKSLHAIFSRTAEDSERRVLNLEEQIAKRDADRRELDARMWEAEDKLRSAETKLGEAARREQKLQEESRKVYENEQMRLEYIQELKRRFEEEKLSMERELMRVHEEVRTERGRRVEAENVIVQVRQDLERVREAYRQAVVANHEGVERLRSQTDKIREIQRHNGTLNIMLSEIQPRLTVLDQDMFAHRLPESVMAAGASAQLSAQFKSQGAAAGLESSDASPALSAQRVSTTHPEPPSSPPKELGMDDDVIMA